MGIERDAASNLRTASTMIGWRVGVGTSFYLLLSITCAGSYEAGSTSASKASLAKK